MIVRFDLYQNVDRLLRTLVDARSGMRKITSATRALDDRRVVAIGGKDPLRTAGMRVPDHGEQRIRALAAVDDPIRIEDLVAAMLGIRLREHHELDVGGIPPQPLEAVQQVVNLIRRQGEPELTVGPFQGGSPGFERDAAQRSRPGMREKSLSLRGIEQDRLSHPIEQRRRKRQQPFAPERLRGQHPIHEAALDPPHPVEAADPCDISGFARPGRDGSRAWHDEELFPFIVLQRGFDPGPVSQQSLKNGEIGRRERTIDIDEVHEARVQPRDGRLAGGQSSDEFGDAECR